MAKAIEQPSQGATKEGPRKGKYPAREAAVAVWRKTALLVSAVQAAWQFQPVFFSTISAASSFLLGLSVCMESLRACACVCVSFVFDTHTHTHTRPCCSLSFLQAHILRAQFLSGHVGVEAVGVVAVCFSSLAM